MNQNNEIAPSINLDDPSLYINRELSWLRFNQRVLEEAMDNTVPLLERLKFLAIFSSNLDEFFMVRVGGLQQKVQAGIARSSGADRLSPKNQLEEIGKQVRGMLNDFYRVYHLEILPALQAEKIIIRTGDDLREHERTYLKELFRREIFPVLTPLAIDIGHPFPHLSNKSLNLGIILQRPRQNDNLFAVVQCAAVLPRFVELPSQDGYVGISLENAIHLHLTDLFPGMTILSDTVFRVTRDNEYEIDDDEVEDLLKAIEEEVRKRRRGNAVRLEIEFDAPREIEEILTRALHLNDTDVYRIPGLIDPTGLFQIHGLAGYHHLRDLQHVPQINTDFSQSQSIWSTLAVKDVLIHHPYESFSSVVDFIESAARDSQVLAIKQTLYRTSSDSPIVRALQRAADGGKQVTAVIELKARLDEERNILWAKELEKAGVHVVFGFVGLKTHCKVALVVRREKDHIRRYVHLSTGNYNPQTARIYTDLGFFTSKEEYADDVSALFNYLTGYSEVPQWQKLVVAPSRLQAFMLEKIDQEIHAQKSNNNGRIIAKLNGLLEPAVIQSLYRASQMGVQIDLICRGICALRPGIPNISENIRVISIIDRFLEHSRIFYFGNQGNPQVYIGSADWMDRNLSRRVEVVFPIEQPDLKKRLIDEILFTSIQDNCKASQLLPDGTYQRILPESNKPKIRSQERFIEFARAAAESRRLEIDSSSITDIATKLRSIEPDSSENESTGKPAKTTSSQENREHPKSGKQRSRH